MRVLVCIYMLALVLHVGWWVLYLWEWGVRASVCRMERERVTVGQEQRNSGGGSNVDVAPACPNRSRVVVWVVVRNIARGNELGVQYRGALALHCNRVRSNN